VTSLILAQARQQILSDSPKPKDYVQESLLAITDTARHKCPNKISPKELAQLIGKHTPARKDYIMDWLGVLVED